MIDISENELSNYPIQCPVGDHENAVSCVKFSPSGQSIASCSYDKVIKLWDAEDMVVMGELIGHREGISDIDWFKDGSRLVSASDDGKLKIWNVNTGKRVKTLRGHINNVFCAKFSQHANLILSGSDDLTARMWDSKHGKCLDTFTRHVDRVTAVDFDKREAPRFLTSSFDGYCYVYDLRSKTIVQTIYETEAISFAKFSGNSNYILFATLNNTLKLWDIRQNKCARTYKGHRNEIFSIIANFSSSGKYLVSGSEDNHIYIWNTNTQELVEVLTGHSACVICVDCHPEEDTIVSGALDGDNSIRIWKSI